MNLPDLNKTGESETEESKVKSKILGTYAPLYSIYREEYIIVREEI